MNRGEPVEPCEDFPYDEIERALDGETANQGATAFFTMAHLANLPRAHLLGLPPVRELVGQMCMHVLNLVRSTDRAAYAADCLVLALGGEIHPDGRTTTMTAVAATHGVTKAAVSKTVKRLQIELSLPPNQYNKSPHARERYRLRNCSPCKFSDD
jgi:hypothetical protein